MADTPRVVMDPSATYRRLVPVERLAPPVTPSDDVYVIAHMGIARVDAKGWRLRVDGLVERPFALDYDALTSLPATEVTAVLECFGNPVEPDVATRRVGNVVWRGVRLAHLLERAGVRPEARLVCPEGLDSGTFANVHSDRYVKDLPLARALEPDVLVAWALNGEPLTAEHGFPARVVVPGYFGTNNVKWLSRLTLAAERPESLFTTRLYMRGPEPVRDLDVHAVIVSPAEGARLEAGRQPIGGWAWSEAPVSAVEVSTDGGSTWAAARVEPRGADHQWQAFRYDWQAGAPGTYALHVRATDARGRRQPPAGRNRIHTIKVTVEGSMSLDRREFLAGFGATVGAAALAETGVAHAQDPARGRIPETPVKFGHITIQSGPGAILGLPSLKGHTLAAEEINAAGGLLGRRKIETLTADEAAGPEATVKEVKRMKLVEKIDYFSGVIAAHNQLAVGPVVEELKLLTIMTEGCIDKLFEVEVPNPRYLFGMTNILSADGVTTALAVAKAWPDVKRIAVINPDYAFGRWFQLHFDAAREKLLPGSEIVSEIWAPFPNTTDFNSHITKTVAAKPDVIVTSMWGGMYVNFYKQGLAQGLFRRARLAGNINFGVVPQAIGKDHPEGALAGVHSNYHFTYSPAGASAANKRFVEAYQKRWNEYPSYAAEAAYTGLYLFKTAVEKANRAAGGGWPEDDAIIKQLEGLSIEGPAGLVTIRKEDHRAYKDVKVGFSKNLPDYPFAVWDPERIMTIPVGQMTAPPTWPRPGKGHNDPSATVNWIKTTWKKS